MTAQKIIYTAWQNTPKPIIYNTSDGSKKIAKEVTFYDPTEHSDYNPEYAGVCSMCGEKFTGGIPVKKIIGKTYTDFDIHKEPQETHLCEACAFCLLTNPKGLVRLSRFSFVADDNLHLCNRVELKNFLINPPEIPFVAACAVSQKKHLAAKTQISYSKDNFFCNYEETTMKINLSVFSDNIRKVEALCGIGIMKKEIEAQSLIDKRFGEFGLSNCKKILDVIYELGTYEALPIVLFVAQKMEEEESICFLNLTQKMK